MTSKHPPAAKPSESDPKVTGEEAKARTGRPPEPEGDAEPSVRVGYRPSEATLLEADLLDEAEELGIEPTETVPGRNADAIAVRGRVRGARLATAILAVVALAVAVLPDQAAADEVDARCSVFLPDTDPEKIFKSTLTSFVSVCNLNCFIEGEYNLPRSFAVDDCSAPPVVNLNNFDSEEWGAIRTIEDEAVQDVIRLHKVPAADLSRVSRVLGYARNDVRANLFARILESASKQEIDRTDDEQTVVDAYAWAVRDVRSEAALISKQEYNRWAAEPCTYVPPEGFSYTPTAGLCENGTLVGLFSDLRPPSLDDFLAYGATEVRRELTDDPEGELVVVETTRSMAFLWSAAEFYAALGVAVSLGLATAIFVYGNTALIFPFWAAAAAKGVAVGIGGAIGAGVAVFAIVVVAVVSIILQGIAVFSDLAIPDQLDQAIFKAGTPPVLEELVQTDEGILELYTVFLLTTLPESRSSEPPPDSDQEFLLTDDSGASTVVSNLIYSGWLSDGINSPWSLRLSKGLFVPGLEVDGELHETMSFYIEYVGWDGEDWLAWRVGDQFVLLKRFDEVENAQVSDEIKLLIFDLLDRRWNPAVLKVYRDETPPEITYELSGEEGANGWFVSDVAVSWNVTDPESEIISESGCGDTTVTKDGLSPSLRCSAESEGGSSSEQVTIARDATAPTITGSTTPEPNGFGWHRNDLNVSFVCDEFAVSGRDGSAVGGGCGPDADINTETAGQEVTGTATDLAGNTSTATIVVKLDKTDPTITGSATPAPNVAGWNNTDVTVQFTCADALSGVLSCPLSAVLNTNGRDQSVNGTALDVAGNDASTTFSGIDIDKTPPEVDLDVPTNNAEYVLNELVLADWDTSDALSGIFSATGTVESGQAIDTTSSSGLHSFTVDAVDVAGNRTVVTHGYTVITSEQAAIQLVDEVPNRVGDRKTEKSLVQKLENAIRNLQDGFPDDAVEKLLSFIEQVKALSGKKIDPTVAEYLIARVELILAAIES